MTKGVREGVVVKVTDRSVVLMCPDGTFKNVPRDPGSVPRIGEHHVYHNKKRQTFGWTRYALVASLFLVVVSFAFLQPVTQAAYMVAIDINPSFEVYADRALLVTDIKPLNDDARQVLRAIEYRRKPLFEVVQSLIEESIEKGYLKEEGTVATTFVPLESEEEIDTGKLTEAIQQPLLKHNIMAQVAVNKEIKEVIKEARKNSLPVNKYAIYKSLKDAEVEVSIEEVKKQPISELVKAHREMEEKKAAKGKPDNPGKGRTPDEPPGQAKKNESRPDEKERGYPGPPPQSARPGVDRERDDGREGPDVIDGRGEPQDNNRDNDGDDRRDGGDDRDDEDDRGRPGRFGGR